MRAPYFIKDATDSTHGINLPRLATEKALLAFSQIPSLTVQHGIVAKVDKLFTICDEIKGRINEAQVTQLNLAKALVERAVG